MAKKYVLFCLACFTWQTVFANVQRDTVSQGSRFRCLEAKGQRLCCPYDNGHFCKGKLSCCPSGTACDQSQSSCEPQNTLPLLAWKTESPVPLIRNLDNLTISQSTKKPSCAPEAQGGPLVRGSRSIQCPRNSTYCKDAYRFGYTCCPITNGTCCGDHTHCCPEGTQCDISRGLCLGDSGMTETQWFRVFRAVTWSRRNKISAIDRQPAPVAYFRFRSCSLGPLGKACPDNSTCPDSDTCCSFGDDSYGCCPLANAVCCSDHLHCCPKGTKCNVAQGTCEPKKLRQVLLQKIKKTKPSSKLVCPGGQFTCPDWTTCCEVGAGKYACCPMAKAVCCSDKRHCCPNGSQCDLENHTCRKGGMFTPLFAKYPACPRDSDF